MNPEHLFVLCLATWRIANLLVNETGPYALFDSLRARFGIRINNETQEKYLEWPDEVGEMLLCVWCTSIWVSLGLTILYLLLPTFTFWFCLCLSMSAVACLLDRYNEG